MKRQTRVPQTYLRVRVYTHTIILYTFTYTPVNHARVRDTLHSLYPSTCVGNQSTEQPLDRWVQKPGLALCYSPGCNLARLAPTNAVSVASKCNKTRNLSIDRKTVTSIFALQFIGPQHNTRSHRSLVLLNSVDILGIFRPIFRLFIVSKTFTKCASSASIDLSRDGGREDIFNS